MNDISINPQIIYYHPRNAKGVSMNLIAFGLKQFMGTTLWTNRQNLKILCDNYNESTTPEVTLLLQFAHDALLDSIRITILFENFMKSLLLLNGYIIHKLDKNHFETLYKQQYKRPIKFQEIIMIRNWKINPNILLDEEGKKNQIKGISNSTIGMTQLMTKEYLSVLNFSEKILNVCTPYFRYRNNLHLYMGEQITLNKNDYSDLMVLANWININIIRIHNQLVEELNKGSEYKINLLNID